MRLLWMSSLQPRRCPRDFDRIPDPPPVLTDRKVGTRLHLKQALLGKRTRHRRWQWAAVSAIVPMLIGGAAASAAYRTEGQLPVSASGVLDFRRTPDYVTVWSHGRIVGFVPQADLYATPGRRVPSAWTGPLTVYGPNLRTIVGHLYSGIGFVPLGTSPQSEPCAPVTAVVGTATGHAEYSVACRGR
jgi:hypothetical protein